MEAEPVWVDQAKSAALKTPDAGPTGSGPGDSTEAQPLSSAPAARVQAVRRRIDMGAALPCFAVQATFTPA